MLERTHTADCQHNRESSFHDSWAKNTRLETVRVHEAFDAPMALENQHILRILGNLNGRKLLDVGAGLGESSVKFALLGADVTATDISAGMMEFAEQLASYHNTSINTIVSEAENLNLEENSFDIIYTANTIHHLADKPAFFARMHRALKPGGIFISWDPIAYNPAINYYRRIATEVRTEDEAPLGLQDYKLFKQYFKNTKKAHFWLLSLAIFFKYFILDRVHPNQDRYWKRIYNEPANKLNWWKKLASIDKVLLKIPGLSWLSWNVVFWGTK